MKVITKITKENRWWRWMVWRCEIIFPHTERNLPHKTLYLINNAPNNVAKKSGPTYSQKISQLVESSREMCLTWFCLCSVLFRCPSFSIGLLISIISMFIVLMVYLLCSEMRNSFYGVAIKAYSVCMILGYALLAYLTLHNPANLSHAACRILRE